MSILQKLAPPPTTEGTCTEGERRIRRKSIVNHSTPVADVATEHLTHAPDVQPPVPPRRRANTDALPKPQGKHSPHWLLPMGLAMIVTLLAIVTVITVVIPWYNGLQQQWHYGDSRIFQMDADVGHGGTSHFLALYQHQEIVVIEIVNNDPAKAQTYPVPLPLPGTKLHRLVTLTVERVNPHGMPGKPDLVLQMEELEGAYPVLYNNGQAFQTTAP